MKLGVFDSGIGGEAVAEQLRSDFPEAEIIVVNDRAHLPYGDRTLDDVVTLTDVAVQPLLDTDCDIIILACNTATAAAIEILRGRYPQQLFIGLEPMVKPATKMTKSGTICICATPATLSSERYKKLKQKYQGETTILEPDCTNWAQMIEDNKVNEAEIEKTISSACRSDADVIVLACTHYHWIRKVIERSSSGRATVIDPSLAISNRVRKLLESR